MGGENNGINEIMENDELKEVFALKCQEWLKAQKISPAKANKLHDEVHELFKSMKDSGSLDVLSDIIHHEDVFVALIASKYYLLHNPKVAQNRLIELSKEPGILGFAAKNTIEQWESGELNLDF